MKHRPPAGFTASIPLGEGGQARTFLCWQNEPGRWVVLKTDPKDRGELEAEADLLERLPGAPVPALLARDHSRSRPWIAMSWIDGIRLDALPGNLDPEDIATILSAAARAVAVLHNRGIVHGDLAPSNILALPAGEVVLVDLGMASIGGSRSGGTWETLAPERIQGKPASPSSDVFSLGVLALRLLGRLPDTLTSSREEWSKAIFGNALSKLAPDLPLLARATATDPASRPSSADFAAGIARGAGNWPRERLRLKGRQDFDALLLQGIERAVAHKAWNDAWRLQRERIERTDDPEPLLPELGRFARARDARSRAFRPHPLAVITAAILLFLAVFALYRHLSTDGARKPTPSHSASKEARDITLLTSFPVESFLLPSIPPGASLRVDGLPTDMPDDGLLLLASGRHRIQLRDAVGTLLLDTFWIALPTPVRTGRDSLLENSR